MHSTIRSALSDRSHSLPANSPVGTRRFNQQRVDLMFSDAPMLGCNSQIGSTALTTSDEGDESELRQEFQIVESLVGVEDAYVKNDPDQFRVNP